MNSKTILIVDDDTAILDALSSMLISEGYDVITDTGTDVLNKVKGYLPKIILLDVLLSGRDGRAICKKIKQQQNLNTIPVILISAHPQIRATYKEYGADAFLAKPFDIDDLLDLIQKYVK